MEGTRAKGASHSVCGTYEYPNPANLIDESRFVPCRRLGNLCWGTLIRHTASISRQEVATNLFCVAPWYPEGFSSLRLVPIAVELQYWVNSACLHIEAKAAKTVKASLRSRACSILTGEYSRHPIHSHHDNLLNNGPKWPASLCIASTPLGRRPCPLIIDSHEAAHFTRCDSDSSPQLCHTSCLYDSGASV